MKLEAKEIYGPIIQGYPLSWYRLAHTFQKAIRCRKMFKLQEKQVLEMKQLWKNFKNTCSGLSTMNIHRKDWCWSSNTLATWCRESTLWKRPWCWERLRAGKEGDDRGWDGWMASPTQWAWVWANSGRQWRTGKPGALQFMGSQRVNHDQMTQQNKTIHQGVNISYQSCVALGWNHQSLCILHRSLDTGRSNDIGKGSFWRLRQTLKEMTAGGCLMTTPLAAELSPSLKANLDGSSLNLPHVA